MCLTSPGFYPGGYCSALCNEDGICGPGAFCETITGNGLCVAACASSADCRTTNGYVCAAPDPDAGRTACVPMYPVLDGGVADAGTNGGG
ncbi:MAG TPA: hypothetical protein VGH28_25595 [Polyangiaceae bacterium]